MRTIITQCSECDALLTRAALLALQLRKLAIHIHTTEGHGDGRFELCSMEPCAGTMLVINKNYATRNDGS